ncbi:hypothetical protein OR1_00802 [Geobacter sp. OR-1]|uniref:hypothetical protein n=1 Tax=Geobacter sp. OR-1 TaxID=1266765 RepID=UPI000542874D|nr:hypothetical protein [Geobacter sp. OR-1]GAM08530.1 hypothetical protein OR1_00802 [Geobacter sp. OR-1]
MVTKGAKLVVRLALPAIFSLMLLLLQGCGPAVQVSVKPDFKPPVELDTVYVVPFSSTLVPADFKETAFNDLVDILNENRKKVSVQQFEIIKGELKNQDPRWLAKQLYISGEFWSYIENAGCCSTELRVRARVALTEPGKDAPTFEITLPLDSYFDHDRSTLEKEKILLAKRLARELANSIIPPLANRR